MSVGCIRRRITAFILASLLCLILSACGLPTYLFLSPPADFSLSGGNQLSLTNNSLNYDPSEGTNQSFKGYEIYYRVYSDPVLANNIASSVYNAANSTTYVNNPDAFMSYTLNTLNFQRLRTIDNNNSPLISLSASEAMSDTSIFVLNLATNADWTLYDGSTYLSSLRRCSAIDSTRSSFQTALNYHNNTATDPDYMGSDSSSTVYFVFFAVAYGNDPASPWMSIYSMPESAGALVVAYSPAL